MLRVVSSLPLSVGHGARISLEKPRMSSLSAANALHNHSTGRWLYNNDQRKLCWLIFEKPPDLLTSFVPAENYARQAYFDMEQLQAVACEAMHATKCIHASKIAEGTTKPLDCNVYLDSEVSLRLIQQGFPLAF